MKTYDVTIRATVTKVIRVEAEDAGDADVEAQEQFSVLPDGDERYEQETLKVKEVQS